MADDKVRFEPCHTWAPGSELSAGACAECGWLEEDHWLADLERRGEVMASSA